MARLTATGRQISDVIGQETLIGFQTLRIMGWVFLLGRLNGEIPWQFALVGIAGYRAMRADEVPRCFMRLDTRGMWLVSRSLEDFEQNKIADQERLSASCLFQLDGRRCPMAAQMRDPNGAVDKDHERAGARP